MLLILDLPRLRHDHEVEFAGCLLMLNGKAAADGSNALVGADKEETPFWRDDGYHMQDLWYEMRLRAPLDQQRKLCRVVRRERVGFGVEFHLYRWELLACACELVLQRLLITREEAGDCPSAAQGLDGAQLGGSRAKRTLLLELRGGGLLCGSERRRRWCWWLTPWCPAMPIAVNVGPQKPICIVASSLRVFEGAFNGSSQRLCIVFIAAVEVEDVDNCS